MPHIYHEIDVAEFVNLCSDRELADLITLVQARQKLLADLGEAELTPGEIEMLKDNYIGAIRSIRSRGGVDKHGRIKISLTDARRMVEGYRRRAGLTPTTL